MDTVLILNFFIALIAIINPIGNSAFFLEQVETQNTKVQIATAFLISITVFLLLILFFYSGTNILKFFCVSMPAFRISGGVILLMMGIRMIHGYHKTSTRKLELGDKENNFTKAKKTLSNILVPIVIPILVGPGTITTVILYSNQTRGIATDMGMIAAMAGGATIVFIMFSFSSWLYKILGENGFQTFMRIMGLIICAIAVQFVIDGIADLVPGVINTQFTHGG